LGEREDALSSQGIVRALRAGAELGEHPLWSAEGACLYWLDIERATINRFDPTASGNTAWPLPARPGCFAFRAEGGAVVAAQDGIYDLDFATGAATRRVAPLHDPAVMRFNDGRTDRQGRLWVGTVRVDMDLTNTAANAYYRLGAQGLEKVLDGVGITNGTAFSPDGTTMYRAQTETRQIFAYDYDVATGAPSNPRVFATVPDQYGMPDGATVDTDGGYWVALARLPGTAPTGGVARFTPDGRLDRYIELPVPFVTMPAFGGPNLSTLYVTTARLEVFMPDGVPEAAGDIFALETEFRGAPEVKFKRP
jgi:sugar lactone lactonase YvrE